MRIATQMVAHAAEHAEMRYERYEEERGETYTGHGIELREMDALFSRLDD